MGQGCAFEDKNLNVFSLASGQNLSQNASADLVGVPVAQVEGLEVAFGRGWEGDIGGFEVGVEERAEAVDFGLG